MLKNFDLQKYKNTNNTSHFERILIRVIKQDFNTPMFKKPTTEVKESINNDYFYKKLSFSRRKGYQHFGIVFVYRSKIVKSLYNNVVLWILNSHQE